MSLVMATFLVAEGIDLFYAPSVYSNILEPRASLDITSVFTFFKDISMLYKAPYSRNIPSENVPGIWKLGIWSIIF